MRMTWRAEWGWENHSERDGQFRRAQLETSTGKMKWVNVFVGRLVPEDLLAEIERRIEALTTREVDLSGPNSRPYRTPYARA